MIACTKLIPVLLVIFENCSAAGGGAPPGPGGRLPPDCPALPPPPPPLQAASMPTRPAAHARSIVARHIDRASSFAIASLHRPAGDRFASPLLQIERYADAGRPRIPPRIDGAVGAVERFGLDRLVRRVRYEEFRVPHRIRRLEGETGVDASVGRLDAEISLAGIGGAERPRRPVRTVFPAEEHIVVVARLD